MPVKKKERKRIMILIETTNVNKYIVNTIRTMFINKK